MYTFDQRNLRTSIAITMRSLCKEEEKDKDLVTYYFHVVLNIILDIMNSETRNIDDAIDEQYREYPNDPRLPFLGELIREEVVSIKKQFISAGFDSRLRYKLIQHRCGGFKLYGIAMDLDATHLYLSELEKRSDNNESEIGFVVSDQPSYDELNQAYEW